MIRDWEMMARGAASLATDQNSASWATWTSLFGVGAGLGLTASVATEGTTLLTAVPLLSAWGLVAALGGSAAANAHQWISYSLAAAMQGGAYLVLVLLIGAVLRRLGVDGGQLRKTVVLAFVAYLTLLLLPAGPE